MTRDHVTFNRWHPSLMQPHANVDALRTAAERGVFLADVYLLDGDDDAGSEVSIAPLDPAVSVLEFAVLTLHAWAETVGHARVWLPDAVLDVPDNSVPGGPASAACPTCGSHWSNGEAEFFDDVRQRRLFPTT